VLFKEAVQEVPKTVVAAPQSPPPFIQQPAQPPAPPQMPQEPQKPWTQAERKPQSRGWLSRLLSTEPPDPRQAPRLPVSGLVAHFFTGGAPKAHEIRDVSATGLYLVTTERWYPGTVIRMTLTKPDTDQAPGARSITVQAKAMRWGNDGVGLQFVVAPRSGRGPASEFEPVDAEKLGAFLGRFLTSVR
jgi:hypothetical protein